MVVKVNLGEVDLPEELVNAVYEHRAMMLYEHRDTEYHRILCQASFSMYFTDYLIKNVGGLLNE